MRLCRLIGILLAVIGTGMAASAPVPQETGSSAVVMDPVPQGPFGIAAKRPVFGGACKVCPWGAVAEIVRDAMKPYGYEVQICYHCARADAPRIVAGAKKPPPWKTGFLPGIIIDTDIPPSPDAPVDFGATSVQNLRWAYDGTHQYAGEGARRNLRLIANIQAPNWLIVGVRHDSGITDLAQLKDRARPVHILTDENVAPEVLAWYGLSKESVQARGGWVKSGADPANRKNFDVVIYGGSLGNAPEFNIWYEVSQRFELDYLQLPDALLDKLVKDDDMQRQDIPDGLLRGIHRRIPSVARTGHVVYTRDDVPDAFAYAVAKALDEQQQLFQWSHINLSYNVHTVATAFDVPLHPGAATYYRERGYLPASLQSAAAQDAAAAPVVPSMSVAPDGTVTFGPRQVPPDAMASPEARAAYRDQMLERMHAAANMPSDPTERGRVIGEWLRGGIAASKQRALELYGDVAEDDKEIGGVPVSVYTPRNIPAANRRRVAMEFEVESEAIEVASLARIPVVAVHYRMAPNPGNREDIVAVYRELLKTHSAREIAFFGTSGGCLLTQTITLWLPYLKLPMPGAVGLFTCAGGSSPGDSRFTLNGLDATLSTAFTGMPPYGGGRRAGEQQVSDKQYPTTPLQGDIPKGYPPAFLLSGTRDMCLSETALLHTKLLHAGVKTELHIFEGMWHAFHGNPDLPESRDALTRFAQFLDSNLGR